MGMALQSLSYRMNGKIAWDQPEMIKALSLLDVPIEEVADYFFTEEVQDLDFWTSDEGH